MNKVQILLWLILHPSAFILQNEPDVQIGLSRVIDSADDVSVRKPDAFAGIQDEPNEGAVGRLGIQRRC